MWLNCDPDSENTMKTIKQDELFGSLSGFLKAKGVELTDGAYTQRIRSACNLLGEAINATQKTAKKAKDEVDKKLDQLRQSVHEATAPKPPPPPAPTATAVGTPKAEKGSNKRKRSATSAKRRQK